ncbi:TPA: hypothetical protein HA324_00150, partial [Candidatus Thalassarchaeaceae archaeon]
PPIFDEDLPAIVIIADNVVVENLAISGFDTAVMINGSMNTFMHNLVISDILSIGIHNLDSNDTVITDLHIHQYTINSIGSKGIFADSGSDNFELSDSFISGYETGIHIASNGHSSSIENVTSSSNDNYGVLVSQTNIEILDSTFIGNGINGINLNSIISGTLTNNIISDNGNAEIRIVSSFNIEIDSNSISDPSEGYGIHSTSSDNLNIHDNNLNLSIWLSDSDFNTITSNIFSEINGGSITYDNAAIIIDGSNNTISDNDIDDVGIAFAFLSGSSNYNMVENNTLGSTGYDIEYYTSGTNNTFINTEIGIVDIDPDSYFEL